MYRLLPKEDCARAGGVPTPDVVILCGGLGTRLRPVVSDRPKVLAEVGGRPFLSILLDEARAQGFQRIILCIGYGGDMVRRQFKDEVPPLIFSEETEPLGTGGAVKKALPLVLNDDFIILNGDTLCHLSLQEFFVFHHARRATLSLVLTRSPRADGGVITLGAGGRIVDFREKEKSAAEGFLSAGVYAASKELSSFFPSVPVFSLEHDVFPSVIRSAPCFGFVTEETALDIGVPERYDEAIRRFTQHFGQSAGFTRSEGGRNSRKT